MDDHNMSDDSVIITSEPLSTKRPPNVTINVTNKIRHERCSGYKELMCTCFIYYLCPILIVAIIGASITYLVYGIIILSDDKDISDNCTGSHLWAYVLTNLILMFLVKSKIVNNILNKNSNKNNDNCVFICSYICCMLIDLGLAIWGSIELYVIPNNNKIITSSEYIACMDLKNSNIWTFGFVTMILQYISVGIILIIITICMSAILFVKFLNKQ